MHIFLVIATAAVAIASFSSEESEHHHWEYVGLYDVTTIDKEYTLLLQKHADTEHDFSLELLLLTASSLDEEGLEEAEEMAEEISESDGEYAISEMSFYLQTGQLTEFSFGNTSWVATVQLNFTSVGSYALFLGHGLEELCDGGDCLRDSDGLIFNPVLSEHGEHSEHEDDDDDDSPEWGITFAGTVVVWAAVFTGVLLLSAGTKRYDDMSEESIYLFSMFASGALLSTAFCLILLEAGHLIESSKSTESEVSALWGTMILVGFGTASVIDFVREVVLSYTSSVDSVVVHDSPKAATEMQSMEVVMGDESDLQGKETQVPDTQVSTSPIVGAKDHNGMVVSILVGDFLHNFCDGVFIGAAFQSCSHVLGWTIVGTTVCHELAQEIADFILLTKVAGFSIPYSLGVNAASGLSVIIGGIVVNAADLSNMSLGMLLAFGAGNYIYLAASELFPSVHSNGQGQRATSVGRKLFGLSLFALGALAIGLVLLGHEHCEAGSSEGGDGHDH